MKSLWQYLRPYKKQLIIGPFFKLVEAILELLVPTIMASYLIDKGIGSGDRNYIIKIGLVMLAIVLVSMGSAAICQYSASIASQGMGTRLRNGLFRHIGTLSHAQLDEIGTSTLLNRITSDVNTIQQAVAMFIRLVIRAPFICIGSFIMAMIINARLSMIILATVPIFAMIIYWVMAKSIPLYKHVQRRLDEISKIVLENLSGVRVVRAFAKKHDERRRFHDANDDYTRIAVRVGKISALLNPATIVLMNLLIVAILYFGGKRVQIGDMTQGEVIAFTTYITYMMSSMLVFANLIVLFSRAFASNARVSELLQMESEIRDPAHPQEAKDTDVVVEFRNVSFQYSSAEEAALSDISFKLEAGKTLGIIGGIGSGKSTLVNLIPRFYDASEGSVLFRGTDVKQYKVETLRQKAAMVMQKTTLFSGTIAENIRQGKPDATMEEMQTAAEIAQAAEFIERKKNGYESRVEAGGKNFSGGQQQRLSIARALVRDSELLILDDSASALDLATDAALRKAIRTRLREKTVIIISQRVHTVMDCDQILVLDEGRCAGLGTHEELMATCEAYRDIYASQTKEEDVA